MKARILTLVAVAALVGPATAAAVLPPGGGGGETLNCQRTGTFGTTQGDGGIFTASVVGPPGGCAAGNIVGFYMALPRSTCDDTFYRAWVFVSGSSNSWFAPGVNGEPNIGYCTSTLWQYSTPYSGGNAYQGIELVLDSVCDTCSSSGTYGMRVYRRS